MMSQSEGKEIEPKFSRLAKLMLPKLDFSNALVINSGDGLVCEFLCFLGIAEVTGIEADITARETAQSRLPSVGFFESLSQLDTKSFELILILDKIDFLRDAKESKTFEDIAKDAQYIVTDLFTYNSSSESEFICVRLSDTQEMFMPTSKRVINQFPDHLERAISKKTTHLKNINNEVRHFRKRLPYAVVLSSRPWSGKTTAALHLLGHLTHIKLDEAIIQINKNELDASDAVKNVLQARDGVSLRGKNLYQALSDNDCFIDFVKAKLSSYMDISNKDIVVDGLVPPEQLDNLHQFLSQSGYYVVEIGLTKTFRPDPDYNYEQMQKFYNQYHF